MTKHQREDIAKIAIYTKKQTYILEKTFSLRITKFFERKSKMQKNRKKKLITTYNPSIRTYNHTIKTYNHRIGSYNLLLDAEMINFVSV